MSKTESRFKSKLESLKKFQHSASTNTAVEKARAFFRSLELKHIGGSTERISFGSSFRRRPLVVESTNNKRSNVSSKIPLPASSSKCPVSSSISSSSSSSIIDDSHTLSTLDSMFNQLNNCDGITTPKIIQVRNPNHLNPKDMIVHRVMDNEEDLSLRTYSYSSGQYKHLTSPIETRIHPPKHYQYGMSNERSHSYSASMDRKREIRFKHDFHTLLPITSLQHSNMTNSGPMYYPSAPSSNRSSFTQGDLYDQPICKSLYRHRPLVYRQNDPSSMMSSSFHEQSHRIDPIIRPLSSSVSTSLVSSWSQSVRRLNLEYASTVNALQKARQSLEQIYPQPTAETVSKYANLVARGINDLSKSNDQELKSSLGTSFCITAPIKESTTTSKIPARPVKITSTTPLTTAPTTTKTNIFTKPKVIRPKELTTFIPSISLNPPKLEPVLPLKNPKDCSDSIANIIKKFNSLNNSHSDGKGPSSLDRNDIPSPSHQNQKASQNGLSQTIICDTVPKENRHSNGSSLPGLIPKALNSPPNRLPPPIPDLLEKKYELEEIPYESASALTSSSSTTSSFSEDSTSSKTSSVDGNHINTPDHGETNLPEETTYTVETFYKPLVDCDSSLPSHQQSELVVIRENATEEQFIMAQKKKMDPAISHRFTINESCVPPLTTPLLTYFNLPGKKTVSIENEEKNNDDNYQSTESSARLSTGNGVCSQDDETINDIITSNPHTNSPPSSSSSHRLISSSSTTSTASSTSTVLLSSTVTQTLKSTPPQIQLADSIKDQSSSVIQSTVSHIPKRTAPSTQTNGSRLKPPSKTISPPSKLKPISSTGTKSTKTMITNNTTTAMTTSMRKATGAMNQSLPMSNSIANKSIQQQTSNSNSSSTKKIPTINGTNMTESALLTDSSMNIGKNRVRSMVNQLNAASRSTVTSSTSDKRIPTLVNGRRPSNMDTSNNLSTSISTSKPNVTPTNRPTLQRAMTINHNGSITPTSSTITSPNTNNNLPSTYKRKAPLIRSTSNVKEGLLRWCQAQVAGYPNVSVTNLSSSWADGLAFCALTHHFFPNAFDYNSLSANNRKENFELAFRVAEEQAGVPQLLDVSDMLIMGNTPDYKCIFTYLNSFLAKVKDLQPITNGIEHH